MSAKHDYHLVDPSIWPMMGALAAGLMTFGGAMFMNANKNGEALVWGMPNWLMAAAGFIGVLLVMFFWWRDVTKEAHSGDHTPVVQLGLRYGVILFIISEIMFFVAFFWAFFDFSLFARAATEFGPLVGDYFSDVPDYNARGQWPPEGIVAFDPMGIPLLNTLILLLSGTTVTWAHHALVEGKRGEFMWGLGITVLLGMIFTLFQIVEYAEAAFTFTDGAYASTFYMATGFHGFHVLIGTIFLAVNWFRGAAGHFDEERHFGFEAAAWYWHFVDVVWLFLYVAVYWNLFTVLAAG